ncbi:MAG: hypothetical protein Q9M92_05770 [Enterobacterales bacterium]|nr:hypothetical protein [Enterobacterales bacterium]
MEEKLQLDEKQQQIINELELILDTPFGDGCLETYESSWYAEKGILFP